MADDRKMVPPKELLDMGIIFEINRRFLHPLGMALAVNIDTDKPEEEGNFGGVWDSRDDPEGFLFGDDLFEEGQKKLQDYMTAEGDAKLEKRKELLGYLIQGEE